MHLICRHRHLGRPCCLPHSRILLLRLRQRHRIDPRFPSFPLLSRNSWGHSYVLVPCTLVRSKAHLLAISFTWDYPSLEVICFQLTTLAIRNLLPTVWDRDWIFQYCRKHFVCRHRAPRTFGILQSTLHQSHFSHRSKSFSRCFWHPRRRAIRHP